MSQRRDDPTTSLPDRAADASSDGPTAFSRRAAIRAAAGAGVAAAALAGTRSGAAQEAATPPADPTQIVVPDAVNPLPTDEVLFRWVDSGDSKALFFRAYFEAFTAKYPNITFDYLGLPWTEIEQVVTLGVRNGNAPDVFQVPLSIPSAEAVRSGWVQPIDEVIPDFANWQAQYPPSSFVEGINVFNGRAYTFPRSTSKRGVHMTFSNTAYVQAAGYDPETTPFTFDTFRDAARKITEAGAGNYYGLMIAGGQPGRFADYVRGMGRLAGSSASQDDIDYRTGEYAFTSDGYVAAIELLLAIRDDGSIFPGALSLNDPQSRAQMPTGVAGMIMEGEFTLPIWNRDTPDFQYGVSGLPIPNDGTFSPETYQNTATNHQWIFADSDYPQIAGEIFRYLGSPEGQLAFVSITGGSDPSVFASANDNAAIDPRVRRCYDVFEERMRLGPDPRIRNPQTSQIYLNMIQPTPNFGQTVQGLFAGQLSDVRGAMQQLKDAYEASLDAAIAAAQEEGAEVSRDDFVFANWDPANDYTEADYAGA